MVETKRRRKLIRELVKENSLSTQQEIVDLLIKQSISTTQASVSRDIKALGLIKVDGFYSLPTIGQSGGTFTKRLSGRVHSVRRAGDNLLVLHTNPGEAGAVALALDGARWSAVVGCVAGDDTVFIACDGKAALNQVYASLESIISEGDV
ncbi:MAG TPA: hypothetical protein PKW95_00380 [bacterium]|nr:hypothetical protein [bacterium]